MQNTKVHHIIQVMTAVQLAYRMYGPKKVIAYITYMGDTT